MCSPIFGLCSPISSMFTPEITMCSYNSAVSYFCAIGVFDEFGEKVRFSAGFSGGFVEE